MSEQTWQDMVDVNVTGDEPHASKAFDFAMLVMAGGQERTEREHADLLAKGGFQVAAVVSTRSVLGIVEAVPADD